MRYIPYSFSYTYLFGWISGCLSGTSSGGLGFILVSVATSVLKNGPKDFV